MNSLKASPKGSALPTLTLLAGVLVGLASTGCRGLQASLPADNLDREMEKPINKEGARRWDQDEKNRQDQLRLCREHAEQQGWRVMETYADHAISGSSLLRPGVQGLLTDATSEKFDIILAEALDRLSRDQEDIAGLYKRMRFAGIRIVTLSKAEISNLHIGLKGTMNALYLQDLADKTRRGLRGRIEAGKSGGGLCYGYDLVKCVDEHGEPVRGDRKINEAEAAIVERIFEDYAAGRSSRSIAHKLNADGIPDPSGRAWGASTIHGNRRRGTGILNNELYIGRLIWNRLRYVKDPDTGKRISRPNPEDKWINQEVPELRIIDADLWQRAKDRQTALEIEPKTNPSGKPLIDRRRPRYLFSGLIKCGCCDGGFSMISQSLLGCSTARNKNTCDNRLTIKREIVEQRILTALRDRLMESALFAEFCQEFTKEMNRLRMDATASLAGKRAELAKIERQLQKLLDDGDSKTIVKNMQTLEAQQEALEAELSQADSPPPLLHPNMAEVYHKKINELHAALTGDDTKTDAAEILRTLIDAIILTPEDGELSVYLKGDLAGILTLA